MTLHGVTPALAVAPAWKRRGLCARAQRSWGQRPGFSTKTDGPLQKEQSCLTPACKSQLHNDKYVGARLCVYVCSATEMDCPMRLSAGVFTGVMTPVRLLDLATGLTLLLLGS